MSRGIEVRRSVCLDRSKLTFEECVEKGQVFGSQVTFQEESVRVACRKHFPDVPVLTSDQLELQENYSEKPKTEQSSISKTNKSTLVVFGIPLGETFSNAKVEKVLSESKPNKGRKAYNVVPNEYNPYFKDYSVAVYDNRITAIMAKNRCGAPNFLVCQEGFVTIEKYLNEKYGKPKKISKDGNKRDYSFGKSEQGLPYRYEITLIRVDGYVKKGADLLYIDADSRHIYRKKY